LFGAHSLQWVGYKILDGIDEPLRVGQFDTRVEGLFVDPLGANDEYQRIARRRGWAPEPASVRHEVVTLFRAWPQDGQRRKAAFTPG
jgi:hypothetical protein